MLPLFIMWLIRRYHQSGKDAAASKNCVEKFRTGAGRHLSFAIIVILVLLSFNGHSQTTSLNYNIIRKGSKVGSLHFTQYNAAGMKYLEMESKVKTSFIFTFTAKVKEEAVYYSNGVLLRSSIYRKMNGTEKVNKQHLEANNQYIIHSGKDSAITKNYPITYTMLSFYNEEPVNIRQVYSEILETFLAIQKTGDHEYKIDLPDGNYNYYYYKLGILNLVELHHSLYSANIVLAK